MRHRGGSIDESDSGSSGLCGISGTDRRDTRSVTRLPRQSALGAIARRAREIGAGDTGADRAAGRTDYRPTNPALARFRGAAAGAEQAAEPMAASAAKP